MKIRFNKTFGKHYRIGWWCVFAIIPMITIARVSDVIAEIPVYCLNIKWLVWEIKINNCKSY